MARPSKFTRERRVTIIEALKLGATHKIASDAAGITRPTLWQWIKKGKGENAPPIYRTFYNAVKRAQAECALSDLTVLREESLKGNWKCSAWRLERRYNYTKNSVHSDDENENPVQNIEFSPEQLLTNQIIELRTAILKAEKSESWQAYAALQRQLLNCTMQLKNIKDNSDEDWESLTDMQILDEITNTIQTLPPVLKQSLLDQIGGMGDNVIAMRKK